MMDTAYVQMGMNVVKCGHCGFDKNDRLIPNGGNVFISIGPMLYEEIRHTCSTILEGVCHLCNRKSSTKFVHTPAPQATEATIKEVAKAVRARVQKGKKS
jgi:hypothetical protein